MLNERGFTLIELMTALAIVAILAAIAWPSYTDWQNRSALDSDVNVLKAALGTARSRSVQEGVYWGRVTAPASSAQCTRLYFGVEADPGAGQLDMLYFCDQDDDGDVDAPGEITTWGNRGLEDEVAITASTTLTNDRIWFNKGGEVFGNTGSVWLAAGPYEREVVISNNGRVRVP